MSEHRGIKEQKRIGAGMQAMAWVVFLLLGVFFFSDVLERQFNPNPNPRTQAGDGGVREVVLQRNRQGHYVTAGQINGREVIFLLDTGATGVAIPEAIARDLGLQRGRAYRTQTANGLSTSYATQLNEVSIGDISLGNVDAGIATGLKMDAILLGMSFLKHIEFTQRGNTLILRQYP